MKLGASNQQVENPQEPLPPPSFEQKAKDFVKRSRFSKDERVEIQNQMHVHWQNLTCTIKSETLPTFSSILGKHGDSVTSIGKEQQNKQILHSCSGFVKPKEMVAIMGPSGSGKTTLLNMLAKRYEKTPGISCSGSVFLNGMKTKYGDFGNYAAFVQQDDALTENLTPYELLSFAASIRTNMNKEQVHQRVSQIIMRLGLSDCKDQLIGGWLRRGISSGERKRTAIGYELVTEPSLLLLDEPTSGLDSATAKRIVQLLRLQADRGMSVLCSLHQPSAELFFQFDRVILLSEGYTIYNGSPQGVREYFEKLDFKMGRYVNPADKLLNIAAQPMQQLNLSAKKLAQTCSKQQAHFQKVNTFKLAKLKKHLMKNKDDRIVKVSFFRQLRLLLGRISKNVTRNPMALCFMFFLAFFQGLQQATVFGGIVSEQFTLLDQHFNNKLMMNLIGLCFCVVMDQFVTLSFAQVMQIPLDYPIMSREIINHMYSPSAFYLAKWIASMCTFFFYPFIVSLSSYSFLGFPNPSLDHYLQYASICALTAYSGSQYGFMMGTMFSSAGVAGHVNNMTINFLNFGGGLCANVGKDANWLVRGIAAIAPQRYSSELMMRQVLKGQNILAQSQILSFFGFTAGEEYCYKFNIGFFIACFLFGWIVMLYKSHYNQF